MSAPRLEIDLEKIYQNARSLVEKLGRRGISITAVTKATLGSPEIANTWMEAGVRGLGDSRVENIESLRRAHASAPVTLIRTPMMSQAAKVVALADVSCNTEMKVIRRLSAAAVKVGRSHGILLMVELGDLREGIMPGDLHQVVREVLALPNLSLEGIGANLACRSGVSPDCENMAELSALADSIEVDFDLCIRTISGGNSANLDWALSGAGTGRVNNLRLGEALLLGREPLHRRPIEGLHTDAFTLVAEVIESKLKPSKPWGKIAQAAFGQVKPSEDRGMISQSILAIGRQDTDPSGLEPPSGIRILGTSSDHLIVDSSGYRKGLGVGAEVSFQLNYSALLGAMTSPFISKLVTVPMAQKKKKFELQLELLRR